MARLPSASFALLSLLAALATLPSCSESSCEERRNCPADPLSIALSAPDLTLTQGRTSSVDVAVTRTVGNSVVVSATDLPDGVTATALDVPLDGEAPVTVALAFTASSNATQQTSTITIEATSGSVQDEETLELTVIGASGSLDQTFGASGQVTLVGGPSGRVFVGPDGSTYVAEVRTTTTRVTRLRLDDGRDLR